jgi:hypothetical protein
MRRLKMAKFPKTLYAKIEDGGTGPAYVGTYDNIMDAAEMGEKITIGVYKLEGVQYVEGVIETRKMPVKR